MTRTDRFLSAAIALALASPLALAQGTTAPATPTTGGGGTATITTASGQTATVTIPPRSMSTTAPTSTTTSSATAPTTAGAATARAQAAAGTNSTGATVDRASTAGSATERARDAAAGQTTTSATNPALDPNRPLSTEPSVTPGFQAPAAPPANAAAIAALVKTQGYTDVTDIRVVDGLWHAEARADNGTWRDIVVDPRNGRVLTGTDSKLDADDIAERLRTAGFDEVAESNFANGVWDVEAMDANGVRFELKLSPEGAIMAQLPDTD